MDANQYYQTLLQQGHSPNEAAHFTSQYYPGFQPPMQGAGMMAPPSGGMASPGMGAPYGGYSGGSMGAHRWRCRCCMKGHGGDCPTGFMLLFTIT